MNAIVAVALLSLIKALAESKLDRKYVAVIEMLIVLFLLSRQEQG